MARVALYHNSASEVNSSANSVLCLWTDPLGEVFATFDLLIICYWSHGVDKDVVYYLEKLLKDYVSYKKNARNKSFKLKKKKEKKKTFSGTYTKNNHTVGEITHGIL